MKLQIQVAKPNTDESPKKGEKPDQLVKRLAREKATSILGSTSDRKSGIFVAADTIVVAPDGKTVLGKPKDVREAERMLGKLQGAVHTVLTGYCLMDSKTGRTVVRVIRSRVKMRKLSKASIRKYVATGEPMDKAGSYGAQGLGMALIESIHGSYTNVVGLPVAQVLHDLEKEFGIPLWGWISC